MLLNDDDIIKFNNYFHDIQSVDDLSDYSFVLTDIEKNILYVAIKVLHQNIENNNIFIDYKYISNFIHNYIDDSIFINENLIQKLLEIAYKKIINVNKKYDEQKLKETTIMQAMSYPFISENVDDSISLEKLNIFSNSGFMFSSTNLQQEFILKYRIGLVDEYKKYELGKVKVSNDFYLDVSNLCYEIGYSSTFLNNEEIDQIIFKTNARLKYVDNVTTEEQEYNHINYLIYELNEMFKMVNTKYSQGNFDKYDRELSILNKKMHILDKKIAEYNIKYEKDLKNPFRENSEKKASY